MVRSWINIELTNGSVIKYVRDLLTDSSGGALQTLTINNGGSGYTTADIGKTITIGAGTGYGAITAVNNGSVTGVKLLEPSSNYTASTGVATTGGTGTGLTLNTTIVPGTGQIATMTVVSGGSGYAAGNILVLNPNGGPGVGARVSTAGTGAVTSVTVVSSGTNYVVGSIFTTTPLSGTGTGCTLQVATVSSGLGVPRHYYAYDGVTRTFYTETGSAGQIQNDFNTIITNATGSNKYLAFPDSYASVPANTLPVINYKQPRHRGLYDINYILVSQITRIYVEQEWFDATGTGILNPFTDTPFAGIDGPTYQTFS